MFGRTTAWRGACFCLEWRTFISILQIRTLRLVGTNELFLASVRVGDKMSDLFHSSIRMVMPLHFKCMPLGN